MRLIITAVLVGFISGCVNNQPKVWYKDGASQENFNRDKIQCQQYGMQSAQANGLAGNMFVQMWINDKAEECMRGLGYSTKQ